MIKLLILLLWIPKPERGLIATWHGTVQARYLLEHARYLLEHGQMQSDCAQIGRFAHAYGLRV